MDKYIVNVSKGVPESRWWMTYSIDVTWVEKLADYIFIFPSLDNAGIRCVWSKVCVDQFLFRKWKTFDNSLGARLDFYTSGTANLSNYAVFLTDKYQMDFRIYRFSSPLAETDQQAATETSERRQSDGYEVLPETDQLSATETSERRQSDGYEVLPETNQQRRQLDGYEVLPGERISGDCEHIVEERGLSDGYESMLNEEFPRNIPCDRNVSSSSHYQTISLENPRIWPRGASALSQKNESISIVSKSCGDLTSGEADTFEHVDNRKTSTEQEPKPFCSTFGRQNSEEEEQPRLHCFMLRDSTDGGSFAGAFYSIEAEHCMELQDFSTRGSCSADADGECEYLTALDSSREHEDYLELIAD
ncbi:hypothetical protein PoB_004412600 [Plakobranchus ocellatus]|uniref:SKICH domain-containing protein n=1 Tax=Plakobranchus ocellatus TaxID=259542 RepID=A0AAV4B2P2_9GAST|nr:hypothetical protein PoB_004412600 [Plakobranchus ocellatus]